jgi:hypothetical protein
MTVRQGPTTTSSSPSRREAHPLLVSSTYHCPSLEAKTSPCMTLVASHRPPPDPGCATVTFVSGKDEAAHASRVPFIAVLTVYDIGIQRACQRGSVVLSDCLSGACMALIIVRDMTAMADISAHAMQTDWSS